MASLPKSLLLTWRSCCKGERKKKRRVCDENFITQIFRWRNDELMELQWSQRWRVSRQESRKINKNLKRGGKAIDCRQKMDITPYNINLCVCNICVCNICFEKHNKQENQDAIPVYPANDFKLKALTLKPLEKWLKWEIHFTKLGFF